MGGLLTCRQCSKRMDSLKDHNLWDFYSTWVRKYFWFIPIIVIVFTLSIIYYPRAPQELGRTCPKDQANLLPNISQLEVEKATLKKQLTEVEKQVQNLRNVMNWTKENSLQLLKKKQEEADALSKESSGFNQSLVLTKQLLEKEKEKGQSLQSQLETAKEDLRKIQQQSDSSCQKQQSQLEIAKEDLRKIQQQRDSWQKQQDTLREKLNSAERKAEEDKGKIGDLQRQIEQGHRDILDERARNRALDFGVPTQKKCSIEDVVDGTIVAWVFGIFLLVLVLVLYCIKCCNQESCSTGI